MNKISLTPLLMLLVVSVSAQKVIENPSFKSTTANYVKITRIELRDTATVIDFETHSRPGSWISIPKDTWIQDSNGGEKLYIKSSKGIPIAERFTVPDNGITNYTLYFPPVGEDVKTIDYLENQWKTYGIELQRQERFSIFPEPLLGNWLRTDGTNEWVYGFHEDRAIYDSDIWKQVLISQKEDIYEVVLQNEGRREKLIIKPQDDLLFIGNERENLESFSKELTQKPDYVIANDGQFQPPVFQKDSAVYCGYIKGYHSEMDKTGIIYVFNIISSEQESYLIPINQDGTFLVKFPMIYPQEVMVRWSSSMDMVYCEPGKTSFYFKDNSMFFDDKRPALLFMGPTARINQDLLAMKKSIRPFNYQDMMDKVLDMSPGDFKSYFIDIKKRELEQVNEFAQVHAVSKKALQIKKMQISFSAGQNMLSYNMRREGAYRNKHKVPREQREIPLERVKLEKEYYDFINPDELNNPVSVVAGGDYYILINRVKYAEPVRSTGTMSAHDWQAISREFDDRGIKLEANEKLLMENIYTCESAEERTKLIKKDSLTFYDFQKKHGDVLREITMEVFTKKNEEFQRKGFKEYFNLESGFAREVMKAQDIGRRMESSFEPLSATQKERLNNEILNEFIYTWLVEKSDELERKVAEKQELFLNPSGFVVNETPEVTEGDLFDTIMKKYRGKVVFVDFWATWCGPCRSGMERIKPLKEELKDKDLVFVYLTNPTSPKKTWEMFIPDIHGEHYYLTQDEWNTVAARFKVSGIPHYVLVDKKGMVVKDKVYFASANAELKKIFEEYIDE